jgi:tRNA G37 N-methylase Trm5
VSPDRYTLHRGDNRNSVLVKSQLSGSADNSNRVIDAGGGDKLHGIADRVNLGLIPSSKQGWPLAVACLKPCGGWIHVHDNVHEDEVHI